MIAFDTNLLVRAAVNDDLEQVAIVRRLLLSHEVFIPRTVLLETEWVLRASYKKTRDQIAGFFKDLLDVENTIIEEHNSVKQALGWYRSAPILPTRCIWRHVVPPLCILSTAVFAGERRRPGLRLWCGCWK